MKEKQLLLIVHKHILWKTEIHLKNMVFCKRLLPIKFQGFDSRINVSGLSQFGSWNKLIFRDSMGPYKRYLDFNFEDWDEWLN